MSICICVITQGYKFLISNMTRFLENDIGVSILGMDPYLLMFSFSNFVSDKVVTRRKILGNYTTQLLISTPKCVEIWQKITVVTNYELNSRLYRNATHLFIYIDNENWRKTLMTSTVSLTSLTKEIPDIVRILTDFTNKWSILLDYLWC